MTIHEKAEYQILLDRASNYIVTHGSAAGLDLLAPVWDEGSSGMTTSLHQLRIATRDGEVDLAIPHDWLPLDSDGHNRFLTQVENALAQLKRLRRRSTQ
jgi:hypothetical protein